MPGSIFDGLEEADLLEVKSFLLKCVKGKAYASQNVPGLGWVKKLPDPMEAAQLLAQVNQALDNLLGEDSNFTDRTYIKAV